MVTALWLSALGAFAPPGEVAREPVLTIDPCVAVDETLVRALVALELDDARRRKMVLPESVTVGCVEGGQEIRVEPWASTAPEGAHTIHLAPVAEDAGAPAVQARSRELALSIAELIRRFEVAHPRAPEPQPPPPPPGPAVIAQPPPAAPREWEVGLLSRFEHFTGGQNLAGVDAFVTARLAGWFLAELRAGGRVGADVTLPAGRLTSWAGTAGAAVGLFHFWQSRGIGAALVLHTQGYLIRFRTEQPSPGDGQTALLGAYVLAAEPRLSIALTRRLRLEARAAVGAPLHGVVVRVEGTETKSVSGVVVSGSLGAGVTF